MSGYIEGKGIFVGDFSEKDLQNGLDKNAVARVQDETGLEYTNTEFVKKNGKILGIKVYVCRAEDFQV